MRSWLKAYINYGVSLQTNNNNNNNNNNILSLKFNYTCFLPGGRVTSDNKASQKPSTANIYEYVWCVCVCVCVSSRSDNFPILLYEVLDFQKGYFINFDHSTNMATLETCGHFVFRRTKFSQIYTARDYTGYYIVITKIHPLIVAFSSRLTISYMLWNKITFLVHSLRLIFFYFLPLLH